METTGNKLKNIIPDSSINGPDWSYVPHTILSSLAWFCIQSKTVNMAISLIVLADRLKIDLDIPISREENDNATRRMNEAYERWISVVVEINKETMERINKENRERKARILELFGRDEEEL